MSVEDHDFGARGKSVAMKNLFVVGAAIETCSFRFRGGERCISLPSSLTKGLIVYSATLPLLQKPHSFSLCHPNPKSFQVGGREK